MQKNAIWTPQPKQSEFLSRGEFEVLYGGAAGGGKSDALLAEAIRQVHIPHYSAIIFRKTYKELSDLISRSRIMYKSAFPDAKYNASEHVWTFPSGAQIRFGNMASKQYEFDYQGRSFDFVGFDELTHFTWEEYSYMYSRVRPHGPGTRCYIRATCNPGGIGHGWVKERFITNKEPLKTYTSKVEVKGETLVRTRCFVPATVFDNDILLKNDPNYVASLAMLPEAKKRALLYGDWEVFSGQVFTEFRNVPENYKSRLNTHVIEPFRIPEGWKRFRSFDHGYTKPFSVGWWAVDYEGVCYRYRELYGCTDEPNVGVKWNVPEISGKIRQIEDELEYDKGRGIIGYADPAIWNKSTGPSVADTMALDGVYFEKGDNTRLAGKMQLHNRLAFDKRGVPRLYVFSNCVNFIRTIPNLVYSTVNVEDIDSNMEDHIYDETRYFLMANPVPPIKKEDKEYDGFDPLNQRIRI